MPHRNARLDTGAARPIPCAAPVATATEPASVAVSGSGTVLSVEVTI